MINVEIRKERTSMELLEKGITKLNQVTRGWIADMKARFKSISEHIRRRIRCIIWKQWKTCKHRYKCLIKFWVSKEKARRTSYSRASCWHNFMSMVVNVAISNE